MTDKQIIFCKEYLIDLNATKAAIRAGYSELTAKTTAYETLNRPDVIEYLAVLMDERSKRLEITADDVLREFASVGMANIKDFLDGGFNVKSLDDIPTEKAKAIKSIKKSVGEFGTTIEFVLHDKIAGLNSIAKHIGFFEKDNSQKNNTLIGIMNVDPLASDATNDSPTENIKP